MEADFGSADGPFAEGNRAVLLIDLLAHMDIVHHLHHLRVTQLVVRVVAIHGFTLLLRVRSLIILIDGVVTISNI